MEQLKAWCEVEELTHAEMLRHALDDPFRTVTLADAHRTPTIVSLARPAYDERLLPSGELDPHRLSVMADALEEAGGRDDLVSHLRSPAVHFRGCHVVDLCLNRS